MLRILIIMLSLLLSLGQFAEMYLPFFKEAIIGVLIVYVLFTDRSRLILMENIKDAFPLFLIFLIFLFLGAILPYQIKEESVINFKFLSAIFLFIFLSSFFSMRPRDVAFSLIFFGIGAGLLSILYGLGFFGTEAYEIRNDRLNLLGENPNSLSVRVSLGILFLVWGSVENVLNLNRFFRVILLIPVPFMFNLILASGSKGSFLLCIASIALYILLLKNISKYVKFGVIISGVVAFHFALSLFFESSLYERFLTSDFTSGRSDIWDAAINIFLENPLGIGEVGYKVEILRRLGVIIDTHNLFVYLLVTGGIIALILFLYFMTKIFIKNIRRYKYDKNIIFLLIFFSMVFVMSKTGGVLSYLIMWYFLACINGPSIKRELVK